MEAKVLKQNTDEKKKIRYIFCYYVYGKKSILSKESDTNILQSIYFTCKVGWDAVNHHLQCKFCFYIFKNVIKEKIEF